MILRAFLPIFAISALAIAADSGGHKIVITENGRSANGKVVIEGDRMTLSYDDRSAPYVVVTRNQIRTVRDVGGSITVETSSPIMVNDASRSNFQFRVKDPKYSSSIVSWAGMPSGPQGDASRSIVVKEEEVWVDAEHRHPAKDNCKGRLIASDSRVRYESSTLPAHTREWEYGQLETFERNPGANEVKLKGNGSEEYALRVAGRRSDEPVFDIIKARYAAARK